MIEISRRRIEAARAHSRPLSAAADEYRKSCVSREELQHLELQSCYGFPSREVRRIDSNRLPSARLYRPGRLV
jgi:hypothetical protein